MVIRSGIRPAEGGMDYQNNDVVETEHRNKLAISEEII